MKDYINRIIQGDCRDILKEFPDNSIDSCVTDPPYGLSEHDEGVIRDVLGKWLNGQDDYVPHKRGFMGNEWDAFVPPPAIWREVYRVLKPGAHILVFAGTRTQDLMSMSLRLAGFEVRDVLMWLYGCVSEDTEILTINGWEHYHKDIDKYPVLCYNIKDERFEFHKPTRKYYYKNAHTAYRIKSDFTDQIITRNHRVLVERSGRKIFVYAEELQKEENIPFLESLQDLPETIYNHQSQTSINKSDLLKKMSSASYKTIKEKETATRKRNGIIKLPNLWKRILASKSMDKEKQKSLLFKKMCWKSKRLAKKLCSFEHSKTDRKRLGELPKENVRGKQSCLEGWSNILQETRQLYWRKIREMSRRISFYGTKRLLRYGTQVDNGTSYWETTIENRGGSSYRPQSFKQHIGKFDVVQKQSRTQDVRITRAKVEEIEYIGNVWCVEVPTGAFVARRNGKIFITGNSGFPKSLDISKAIDKQLGAKREKTGIYSKFDRYDIPATPEVKQWEGWGTALKPAYEPIILARKPISEKNIVLNVLKWGVGGINIDNSRIAGEPIPINKLESWSGFGQIKRPDYEQEINNRGRFPSNVLLECICDEVIEGKAGIKTPRSNIKHGTGKGSTYLLFKESGEHYKNEVGTIHTNPECPCYMLDGQSNVSASRFFYVSKASKSERLGIDKIEIILYNISNNNSEEDILCKGKTLIQGEKLVQLQVDMDILPPKVIVEYGMQNKNVLEWSMSWFGKNIMDKYQKDFASIILTETNLTITSKIYNWLVFLLTNEYIVDVNLLMENGGNLVENANNLKELIISINKIMASRLGVKSVISNPLLKISVKEEKITHCTQKPIKLMEYLIRLITPADGIVLDPFAGSGSTCIACKKLGYKYIGIEISEEYCEIARNRIGAIPDTIFTIPPQEE